MPLLVQCICYLAHNSPLLSTPMLLTKLGWIDGVQHKVVCLAPLHRTQLAGVDHQDLALLLLPTLEGEAVGVLNSAVVVAPQKEEAIASIPPNLVAVLEGEILALFGILVQDWRAFAVSVTELAGPEVAWPQVDGLL